MEEIGSLVWKKPYLMLMQFAVGFVIGAGIILYLYDATRASMRFFHTASFSILLGILVGLLFVFAIPMWVSLEKFDLNWKEHRFNLIASSLLLFILLMAPLPYAQYIANIPFPLYKHMDKMLIIFTLTYFSVLPGAIGLWLTNYGASEAYKQVEPTLEGCFPYIEKSNDYFRNMQLYLAIAGILISLVVLSAVALRDALIQYDPVIKNIFTIEMTLAFGLYFTLLLAFLYIPTYAILQFNGRMLRDQIYPVKSLTDYAEKEAARHKFEEILNLRVGVIQNLRSSVVILAPLLTSFLSSMFT